MLFIRKKEIIVKYKKINKLSFYIYYIIFYIVIKDVKVNVVNSIIYYTIISKN